LENGQAVHAVAELVEETVGKTRGNVGVVEPGRSHDRLVELVASQAGDEVTSAVHRFGQTVEDVAVAKEIRAHRQRLEVAHGQAFEEVDGQTQVAAMQVDEGRAWRRRRLDETSQRRHHRLGPLLASAADEGEP
jgi:hypothetical protein